MFKGSPECMGGVDESDCEPLGWHRCHDWRTGEQLDMLDSGLLSAAVVLLAFWPPGHKTTQLPPPQPGTV